MSQPDVGDANDNATNPGSNSSPPAVPTPAPAVSGVARPTKGHSSGGSAPGRSAKASARQLTASPGHGSLKHHGSNSALRRFASSKHHIATTADAVVAIVEENNILHEGVELLKHPRHGAPARRFLYMDAAHRTLFCVHREADRAKFEKAGKAPPQAFLLGSVVKVVRGRMTQVFARTMKYYAEDEQDSLDQRCLSLIMRNGRTLDLELDNALERNNLVDLFSGILQVPVETPAKACGEEFTAGGTGLAGLAYRVTYNVYMERFILACIVGNIIIMAVGSPLTLAANPDLDTFLGNVELFFSIVFTIEMFLRIAALEGVMPYLSDPWNALDAIIVVGGWVTELPFMTSFNFSALRAFRALRVLRTIKFMQGIREILETFGATLGMVAQAMLVFFYFLFLFCVMGIELFADALNHQCTVDGVVATPRKFCSYNQNTTLTPQEVADKYWWVSWSWFLAMDGCLRMHLVLLF